MATYLEDVLRTRQLTCARRRVL